MADVTTPLQTTEAQPATAKTLDSFGLGNLLNQELGTAPVSVPRETPQSQPQTQAQQTTEQTQQTESTTEQTQQTSITEGDWTITPDEQQQTAQTSETPSALLDVITQSLGLENLPEGETERTEAIAQAIDAIRSATRQDEYTAFRETIRVAESNLSHDDDTLVFLDKYSRLSKDMTQQQIEDMVDAMPADEKKRVADDIRTKQNQAIQDAKNGISKLEKDAVEAKAKQANEAKQAKLDGQRLLNEALDAHKIGEQQLPDVVKQAIRTRLENGSFMKALTEDFSVLVRAAIEVFPDLRDSRDKVIAKTIGRKAVSEQLSTLDNQRLNIGNGSYQTPAAKPLGGQELGRILNTQLQ